MGYLRTASLWLVAVSVWMATSACAAEWSVGTARVDITPRQHLWLGGYASRERPAEGVLHELWAKTLVIGDRESERIALITLDLIGDNFGAALADQIRAKVSATTSIEPDNILFNFSHTHTGPVTRINDGALVTYGLDESQQNLIHAYTLELEGKLVSLVERASQSMGPAKLFFAQSEAPFAANRRIRHNPAGPVEHAVPVLKVTDESGKLVAVLFGYACHTATLTGDQYRYSGDYAGFAQIALEQAHPGVTALFMMGCGGDANPAPRGTVALAQQHGETLAAAVERGLAMSTEPLGGPLEVHFDRVELSFVEPPTRAELQRRRGQGSVYEQRLTDRLLLRLERQGRIAGSHPFPVHTIRFGSQLTFVGFSGETVVDYAIRLRRELPAEPLWIAGYCNDVFAYIPSERVLAEGGYEAGGAMQYFGIHGPFKPGLEDRILGLVKQQLQR